MNKNQKINSKVCVIGLGYVGLPLALKLSESGWDVTGYDTNKIRVDQLSNNSDITKEVEEHELISFTGTYTSDILEAADCTTYIVTVPTPIDSFSEPDLGPLKEASRLIANVLKFDDLVIYESTVFPGVTEEYCIPILEHGSGLLINKNFHVGYSPERINPGDKTRDVSNIVKVISASSSESLLKVEKLYRSFMTSDIYIAENIKVAEASKLLENTQRDVNIALMNEFSEVVSKLGVDMNEVINAAASKWNFQTYFPGMVGGHCIGVDPFYFIYRAKQLGSTAPLVTAARNVNNAQVARTINEILRLCVSKKIDTSGARVLQLGVTFKPDCPDIRNSLSLKLLKELHTIGFEINYHDPYIDFLDVAVFSDLREISSADILIVAVPHHFYKDNIKEMIKLHSIDKNKIFIDLQSAFPKFENDFQL